MKALTLWQPWAHFVAAGIKEIETRSWQTSYRGPLAIHSAKEIPTDVLPTWHRLMRLVPMPYRCQPKDVDTGCICAIVQLVDILPVPECGGLPVFDPRPDDSTRETLLGEYSAGRFAWRLEHLDMVQPPIFAKGKQGLWDWKPKDDDWTKASISGLNDAALAALSTKK